jgi:hypothetical protein
MFEARGGVEILRTRGGRGSNLRIERRRSRRRAWRDGLADQTVVNNFEDIRSYRASALVGSVDTRSVIKLVLVHRLASLLWRLRRVSAIEMLCVGYSGMLPRETPHYAAFENRPPETPPSCLRRLSRSVSVMVSRSSRARH